MSERGDGGRWGSAQPAARSCGAQGPPAALPRLPRGAIGAGGPAGAPPPLPGAISLVLAARRAYLRQLHHYRLRIWSCKYTGASGLTYEEAVLSEQRVGRVVDQVRPAAAARQQAACRSRLHSRVHWTAGARLSART